MEDLRQQFPALRADRLPLDLITFAELELKLDLIPDHGMLRGFGADAAILSDITGIYVDSEAYDPIDSAHDWNLNRLRFSLARKIGHLFLHREIFEESNIQDAEHYLGWINDHNGRKYEIDREAKEFAGRLLVPVDVLQHCFDRCKRGLIDCSAGTLGSTKKACGAIYVERFRRLGEVVAAGDRRTEINLTAPRPRMSAWISMNTREQAGRFIRRSLSAMLEESPDQEMAYDRWWM